MSKTLIEQLDEFVAAWKQRVPADRRAAIVPPDQNGAILDVSAPLRSGPVVAAFYRDGFEGCSPSSKRNSIVILRTRARILSPSGMNGE